MSVAATFTASFLVAAVAAFAVVGLVASRVGIADLPFAWRLALGAGGMVPLAIADLRALSRSTYCPIGWRRQTPRALLRRHHMLLVATVWGLDTGLVVTTFRVAAVSWAALYLAALDLVPGWVGLAYGVGFILPFMVLTLRPGLGQAARRGGSTDPGLEAMLRLRSRMQIISALLLTGTAVVFASWVAAELSAL